MKHLETGLHAAISLVSILASFASGPTRLAARGNDLSLAEQSTPKVRVLVYGFPGLGPYTMQGAETEATRILRIAGIEVGWIDCTRDTRPVCTSVPAAATDLIVRILPKALPWANSDVLGLAGPTGICPAAFLFFDRISALRTHTRRIPLILGRVMAHEMTHLLLPEEGHSISGLMKGQLTSDDLGLAGSIFLGLSRQAQDRLREQISRRIEAQSSLR
jgi:hypothetical protein